MRVEPVAHLARSLAGAGAGMGAFKDDAELVTGQHREPVKMSEIPPGLRAVVRDLVNGAAAGDDDGDVLVGNAAFNVVRRLVAS